MSTFTVSVIWFETDEAGCLDKLQVSRTFQLPIEVSEEDLTYPSKTVEEIQASGFKSFIPLGNRLSQFAFSNPSEVVDEEWAYWALEVICQDYTKQAEKLKSKSKTQEYYVKFFDDSWLSLFGCNVWEQFTTTEKRHRQIFTDRKLAFAYKKILNQIPENKAKVYRKKQ